MEDLIDRSETEHFKYFARQAGGGKRKFYFYVSPDVDFISLIDELDLAFHAYEKTAFNFEDTDCQTYLEDFYPSAIRQSSF